MIQEASPPAATASESETPRAGVILGPALRPPGILRRLAVTWRHTLGLLAGAVIAAAREPARAPERRLRNAGLRVMSWVLRPFVSRRLRREPFPVQLRTRLEMLGPTYVKLGQILSMRGDILPAAVTRELSDHLLDGLPGVRFEAVRRGIERDLGRPLDELFLEIDEAPFASASIAQAHFARTSDGNHVVLKVVKPGIRETLRRDAILLGLVGSLLQLFLSRYQPKRIIREFCDYTLREVDLAREADNIETFAANFRDLPDVVFPAVDHRRSGSTILCMEFLDGLKPTDPAAAALPEAERMRLIELGAEAIIRMIYRDGFFHADLHPANLLILPGTRVGFIDLGMVGRLDDDLRRTLMYYYYCLVIGDTENAARYLTGIAIAGPGSDPNGFRREIEDLGRRWRRSANFERFSLARLILESLTRAAHFRMVFPVEMVLMVKALITYEGVGHILIRDFDVAAVSKPFISKIFINQFNPLRIAREGLRGAPEIVDALVKAPLLVTEGLRVLERTTRRPPSNPLGGVRGTLFAGFCLVAGAILAAFGKPIEAWAPLFVVALILALRRTG